MHPTALPTGTLKDGADRILQPRVRIRHHQRHPAQPASFQRPQKPCAEGPILGVSDIEAEHPAAPVGCNPDRDDDRLGDDPVVDARFAVGGIEEHMRVVQRGQVPVAELGDLLLETRADS